MNNMSFYLPCIPPLYDHKIHPHHHHAIIEKVHRDHVRPTPQVPTPSRF